MTMVCTFPGSRVEPAEYTPNDPVECIQCGWVGDAEDNSGEYDTLRNIPEDYPWAMSGDAICHDCTLSCADCGEDLLDGGVFLGCAVDDRLMCWFCMGDAIGGGQ